MKTNPKILIPNRTISTDSHRGVLRRYYILLVTTLMCIGFILLFLPIWLHNEENPILKTLSEFGSFIALIASLH